jgi:hypothetical protein
MRLQKWKRYTNDTNTPSIKKNKIFRSAIGRSGAHWRKLCTTFCLSATFWLE